jgi:hypothetical protein
MEVYNLTIEQKDSLIGQTYDGEQLFNPTLDADGKWFISVEEITNCTNNLFKWVKDLPLINYNPIINELF